MPVLLDFIIAYVRAQILSQPFNIKFTQCDDAGHFQFFFSFLLLFKIITFA